MCYQHHTPRPYARVLVRGLWRLIVLSGLLWLLLPAGDVRAQEPGSAAPATPVLSATE